MKKILVFITMLTFLLVVAGCGGQKEQGGQDQGKEEPKATENVNLTIASGPQGGTWYPLGGAIANVIQDNIPGAVVSVQQGGGEANAKGVDQGMYDIGITYSHTAAEAISGKENFEQPLTNISALAGLYPSALQIVVRADSDIKEIEDLKGKRISPGPAGLSGETLTRIVLGVHGLTYEDMAKVERVSYSDSANLFKDRQIDMYDPITTWPAPSIQEIALSGGIRLLPIRPEKMEELKQINSGYSYVTIEAGTYNGLKEDVKTLGSNAILIIRKDMPEDLAYKIGKIISENLDELKAVHNSLEYMTKDTLVQDLGLPLHPGVEKAYKEAGIL